MKGRKHIPTNKIIPYQDINELGAEFFGNNWEEAPVVEVENKIIADKKDAKIQEIKSIAESNPIINFTKSGSQYPIPMQKQEMLSFLQNAVDRITANNFTLDLALQSKNSIKKVLCKATEKNNILTFLNQKISELFGSVDDTTNSTQIQYLFCGRSANSNQTAIQNSVGLIFNNLLENNGIVYNTATGRFTLKAGIVYEIYCNALFTLTAKTGNASTTCYMRLGNFSVAEPSPTATSIFSNGNIQNIAIGTQFAGIFKILFSPPTDGEYYIMMKGDNAWTLSMDYLQSSLLIKSIGVKKINTTPVETEVNAINSLTSVAEINNYSITAQQTIINFPESFINSVIV